MRSSQGSSSYGACSKMRRMAVVNYEISPELHQRLKVLAAQQGMTLKAVVQVALAEYADRQEKAKR